MPRIAVTTIMKNEAAHVRRWAESCADADLRVLTDTGSTDGSVELARETGVTVHEVAIKPWRFDDARNAGLALLPDWDDLWVVTVDVDEVLTPGWRQAIEKTLAKHRRAQRLLYTYVWSWVEGKEGIEPDVIFDGNRCHPRANYRWRGPVHEVVGWCGPGDASVVPSVHAGFRIEHYPDSTKSRSSYLPLLQLAVREEPDNPRQAFYLGREYWFAGRWVEARAELMRFLELPAARWPPERAAAWRIIAKIDDHPERWILRAIAEDPDRREPWVDLMDLYLDHDWAVQAAGAAARALAITRRGGDYLTEARAWDDERLRWVVGRLGRGGAGTSG